MTTIDLEPELGDAVTLAYVNSNNVTYSWHHSMIELLGYDLANQGRLVRGGYIGMRHGTGGLVQARNKAVLEFLANRAADWLLWIDTDMGFPPDTIEQLLAAADPIERPVVGALCFANREDREDGLGGWHTAPTPTIYDWVKLNDLGTGQEQQGFAVRWDYQRDAVVQCAGTGSACILIHRSVFERMADKFGPTWYDRIPNTWIGELTSEDLSFCMRLGMVGVPLFVHTGVKTTHQKTVWVGEDLFRLHQAPPPATAECAVIVPVMNRPQNAAPFMASLRATTGMATVYAVANDEDTATIEAWAAAGAVVLRTGLTTFAEKVNAGYAATREPWMLLVGDDVRFWPSWLDRALEAAGDRYTVVGTNDLTNPRVMSGEHATHLLIRRDYADTAGASWDGPGVVAHEGYRHWYVDDEIVTAAKQRGLWAMALDSRIEHLHPLWGKGDLDDVYALGRAHADEDQATFAERRARYS